MFDFITVPRVVGEAEAAAIQAKGLAEAEAMEKKAEAYAKYNKAAVAVMAKLFESMREATGIDLADIIKADTYDAKVNRNVNVTGVDGIHLTLDTQQKSENQPAE